MSDKMNLVWHYTDSGRLLQIIEDGLIRPSDYRLKPKEKPIVWFSTNPVAEKTSCGWLSVTLNDGAAMTMIRVGDSLVPQDELKFVRIGVDPSIAPLDWTEAYRQSRMPRTKAATLYRRARQVGADPSEWRGSLDPVSSDHWQAIEWLDGDQWTDVLVDTAGFLTPPPMATSGNQKLEKEKAAENGGLILLDSMPEGGLEPPT